MPEIASVSEGGNGARSREAQAGGMVAAIVFGDQLGPRMCP